MFKILERFRKAEYDMSENDVGFIVLDWNAPISKWSKKIAGIPQQKVCLLFKGDYDWTDDLQQFSHHKLLDFKKKIHHKKCIYFVVLSYGNDWVNPQHLAEEELPTVLNDKTELSSVLWYGLQSELKERVRTILSQLLENHYEQIHYSLIQIDRQLMRECESKSIVKILQKLRLENPDQISAIWQKISKFSPVSVQIIKNWLSQDDVLESIINQLTNNDKLSLRAILVTCIDNHFIEDDIKEKLCIMAEIGGKLIKYTGSEVYDLAIQEGKLHLLIFAMSNFNNRAEATRNCLMEHLKEKEKLVNSIIQANSNVSIYKASPFQRLIEIIDNDDTIAIKDFLKENFFTEEHNTFIRHKEIEFFVAKICEDREVFTSFVQYCFGNSEDMLSDLSQREDFKEIFYAWFQHKKR